MSPVGTPVVRPRLGRNEERSYKMPRYRLKAARSDDVATKEAGWLDEATEYHGIALLQFSRKEKVRLFHPDGEGTVELSRGDVELC